MIQQILHDTNHPELPEGEITFNIHVEGAEKWSWADIRNNKDVPNPGINIHNEIQGANNCVERMIAEKIDLRDKLEKLSNFIISDQYYDLPENERNDLTEQFTHMADYHSVLSRRIRS